MGEEDMNFLMGTFMKDFSKTGEDLEEDIIFGRQERNSMVIGNQIRWMKER